MSINVDGNEIPTTATGFLENVEDWSESVARVLAEQEKLELAERHWDLINHLRDEYINNAGNQPNTRNLVKAMASAWGDKSINAKTLYDLFPGDPSKQGGRIAGLPESRRKGGY
ncbi:MAG: TusE/DsrC/DsvC family sulfur relay protein [Gammaproteobacteria bacterium]|nr:TusE/DsrC/DsvC family sulfur relay protein [Gammaproteobacteria bacterium]MDH3858125.1 TusE/DsrC/DsvC family sulfur relay protein [Gammaproteobacteria bacterium]